MLEWEAILTIGTLAAMLIGGLAAYARWKSRDDQQSYRIEQLEKNIEKVEKENKEWRDKHEANSHETLANIQVTLSALTSEVASLSRDMDWMKKFMLNGHGKK